MRCAAIVNPQSGGGKTIKVWRQYGEKLTRRLEGLEVHFTERSHHATELARDLATRDIERLIVVGGDGTLHEVVNGLFDRGKPLFKPDFTMGILNGGRGCDFVKSLDLGQDADVMFHALLGNKKLACDVGQVILDNRTVYYINSATFGLGGEVAGMLQGGSAFLPPSASYLTAAIKGVLRAKARPIRVKVDGRGIYDGLGHNVFVCNGKYSGGGMLWAPKGSVSDGRFDVIVVANLSKVGLFGLTPRLYAGTIASVPGVSAHTGSHVTIDADSEWMVELDGETYSTKSAEFNILPRTLNVLVS